MLDKLGTTRCNKSYAQTNTTKNCVIGTTNSWHKTWRCKKITSSYKENNGHASYKESQGHVSYKETYGHVSFEETHAMESDGFL